MKNLAFIDGQNLHLGTSADNWSVNFKRFRIYLKDKYKTKEAYYFFGYISEQQTELYAKVKQAGFTLVFKEHHKNIKSQKKGNVDTDIVFEIMKSLIEKEFHKVILVSGDGDYKKTVDYLIQKEKFEKIIFPNIKFASSLYKKLGNHYQVNLGSDDIRKKITHIKKKVP
ncbi:hypothetical protein COB57_02675 [Candidatus Peregrinibacteria bacterium]|nr:MAG: hypothetical protein COB57_02675 [Candidatus Peregrinibacteria bacterium]